MSKIPLAKNALEVLKKRYLLKNNRQEAAESPQQLFKRVASNIARNDEAEEKFYRMMSSLEFMPNSPTLMNAGTCLNQLSACFVLPVEDSMEGIFTSLKNMAKIHQTGGGTGFSFSRLRPKGDLVSSTKGQASGVVSFMEIFDKATGVIVQGGRRRGANMGILRCDHPDIVEFVEAKRQEGRFSNFNLSVGITDKFMEAQRLGRRFSLVNPRTHKKSGSIKARELFKRIIDTAWLTGDPGLVFLDEINRHNPTPLLGDIEATNPCGELPLLAYESCNLGSINLAKMIAGNSFDWDKFADRISWAIRFLDDVIEANKFPLPEIREITFANRKIGLGVMGFADALVLLGLSYDSHKAVEFARKLMRFMRRHSLAASSRLAAERGVFPNFTRSIYAKTGLKLRNATVNTIAPTGTISIIAGCSSGIEPLFAVSFVRNVLSGQRLFEVNAIFKALAKKRGFYSDGLISRISCEGSLKGISGVPQDIKNIFVTAFDVPASQHLKIQAAFQEYTDNSVSKTINLPRDAGTEDIKKTYLMAYKLKCKGITVYRYGSKANPVLSFGYGKRRKREAAGEAVIADSEYSGGCASGICPF
ncbi:MAG: adenosylcobalamin-dependent ribonucleoside-diphosphate reductase [Candidatus Omnitrophota bacterium]